MSASPHSTFRNRAARLSLYAVLITLTCCANPLRVPASKPLDKHMHDHFSMTLRALDGVIRGDVTQSRNALVWLALHSYEGELPVGAQRYIDSMQRDARDALYADSLDDAARAVAKMGSTCGACHTAFGGGPHVSDTPPPGTAAVDPRAPGALRPRMHQHAWAAEKLWLGLITPSPAAWSDGSNVLHELAVERDLAPSLRPQLARIRTLGEPVAGDLGAPQLGERYAEIIAACGACHGALGAGP